MIGETLRGYRVVEKLGAGGMGLVFVGEHEFLGKRAAIKMLLPELSEDDEIVRRFFNEARAATQVRHPGIVEVFDFGYHTDGRAFIIMELLEGESLARRLKRTRRLPMAVCMRLLSQMGGALGAAHAAGIVHRDFKPDNVFIVRDPDVTGGERAKVLDFGIAKLAGDLSADGLKTRTGSIMGTPRYMAPEQCRGSQAVDHRADLYALGCIAYEMLCGRPPFVQRGLGDLFAAHMFEAPPPPATITPSIPPVVESAILRLLAKNPDERFPSAEAFVQVLNSAGSGDASITPAPVVDDAWSRQQIRQNTTLSDSIATFENTRPRASRRSRWQRGLALSFLIIGGASAAIVSGTNEQAMSPDVLSTQGGKTNTEPPGNIESPVQPAPSRISAGSAVATLVAPDQPTEHQADAPQVALEEQQQEATIQGEPNAGVGDGPAHPEGSTTGVTSLPEASDRDDATNKGNRALRESPNRSDVTNSINAVRNQVAACGKEHPGAGEARITVVVEPSGSVAATWLKSAPSKRLGQCMAEAIKRAKFPRSQKGTTFTYPFVFGGNDAAPERPSRTDIVNAINVVRPRIFDCDRNHPGSGEVKLTLVVEPSGSVGSISVRSAAINERLGKCVAEVMKQAKFPRSQKGETFTYPFVF